MFESTSGHGEICFRPPLGQSAGQVNPSHLFRNLYITLLLEQGTCAQVNIMAYPIHPSSIPVKPRPEAIVSSKSAKPNGDIAGSSNAISDLQTLQTPVKHTSDIPRDSFSYPTPISAGRATAEAELHAPPSLTKLGKRKAAELLLDKDDPNAILNEVDQVPDPATSEPIAILPTPLPSKRLNLRPGSKDNLIPVERLPVYPLPPLPPITDEALRKQVFVHQSKYEKVKGKFQEPASNPDGHYEKLEHVGDSILGMIVTTWLHETRPLLTCGTASVCPSPPRKLLLTLAETQVPSRI